MKYGLLGKRSLPFIGDYDILIVGSSLAAVNLACKMAFLNFKVFLLSPLPYMGEDICGSFKGMSKEDTPFKIKKALEDRLIDSRVDFLYSSFASDLTYDKQGQLNGLVIANRTGMQLLRGKVIVDASKEHSLARMAGGIFKEEAVDTMDFSFTVVRDKDGKIERKEHTFSFSSENIDFVRLNKIKQEIIDKTWTPDQVDSSDLLWYKPKETFVSCEYENLLVLGDIDLSDLAKEIIRTIDIGYEYNLREYDETPNIAGEIKINDKSLVKENVMVGPRPVPVIGEYEVLVAGGGNSGANVGISASRHGAKTLVVDYMQGLGGTQTYGMIGVYWDGFREGFTKEIDEGIRSLANEDHPRQIKERERSNFDWRLEWYRRELRKAKGDLLLGAIVCGALVEQGKVKGALIASSFGLGLILSDIAVDSTGSCDLAICAGADYEYTNSQVLAVQGAGLPPINLGDYYKNTDWTFVDDSDIFDVTRLFVEGKAKFDDCYDIGKLPQTRERRRLVGEYKVSVLDVIKGRRYPDTISYHKSSFDTHGYTIDPYFTLFPPEKRHAIYDADLPLRSLIPKGLENILVTGLGVSAHRDAMPVIRMQPCLQNQGYSVGYLCAKAIEEGKSIKEVDIKEIQKFLVEKEILPKRVLTDEDNYEEVTFPVSKSDLLNEIKLLCSWDEGWPYTGMGQFGPCMSKLDSLIMTLAEVGTEDDILEIESLALKLDKDSAFSHIRAISYICEKIGGKRAREILHTLLEKEGMSGYHVHSLLEVRDKAVKSDVDVSKRNQSLKEVFLANALYRCGDYKGKAKEILKNYSKDLRGHYSKYASFSS